MKKRIVTNVAMLTMTAVMLTACGSKETSDNKSASTKRSVEAEMQDNLLLVNTDTSSEEKVFTFLDSTGNQKVYKGYDTMSDFVDGYSVVRVYDEDYYSSEYTVINKKEKQIFELGKYEDIRRTGKHFLVETDDYQQGIVDVDGNEILMGNYSNISIEIEDKIFRCEVDGEEIFEYWLMPENGDIVQIATTKSEYGTGLFTYNGLASQDMALLQIDTEEETDTKYYNMLTGELLLSVQDDVSVLEGKGYLAVAEREGTVGSNPVTSIYHIYALNDEGAIQADLSGVSLKSIHSIGGEYYVVVTDDYQESSIIYDTSLNELNRLEGTVRTIMDIKENVYFVQEHDDVITLYNEQFQEIVKCENAYFKGNVNDYSKYNCRYLVFPVKEQSSTYEYEEKQYSFDGTLIAENLEVPEVEPLYFSNTSRFLNNRTKVYSSDGEILLEMKDASHNFSDDERYFMVREEIKNYSDTIYIYDLLECKQISTIDVNSELPIYSSFVDDMNIIKLGEDYYTLDGKCVYQGED